MSKDFSAFKVKSSFPKKVEAPGESENTSFNHSSVRSAAQRVSGNASQAQTDYSIKGKKRKGYTNSQYQGQGD